MSLEALAEMVRRNLAHVRAGTVDQADEVFRVPAAHYLDPGRWRQEMDAIFRRLPLVLGFSAELREPGAYRALDVADVPVLLTRDADGAARAFLNVCSHRGAIVVEEGGGRAKSFTCPYHGWSYDPRGQLIGISNRRRFGDVDASCLGLTELACAERAGLVFAALEPDAPLDIDTFLCGYDDLLAHLGFADAHVVGRQSIPGPNWKIAYDGYLDFYHLPILHRKTFGPNMPSDALFDAWGPHQRVTAPNPLYEKLEGVDPKDWNLDHVTGGVWTIFPHVSIADFDAGGRIHMVSQLFPGATPGESLTVQTFLSAEPPDEARQEKVDGVMGFLDHVVRNEDYSTGLRIQRALASGAKSDVLFGRNEGGGQRFHRWVDDLIRTPDADLPRLFRGA